jgi:uncharacterized protein
MLSDTKASASAWLPIQPPSTPWRWSQRWRDLLFCHWQVPAAALQAHIPTGLQLDTWQDTAWVSTVSFRLQDVRRRWLPALPPMAGFLELNLRTYVRFEGEPAIYFLRIHAGKRSVVFLTRRLIPLPYFFAHITYTRQAGDYCFDCRARTNGGTFTAAHSSSEPQSGAVGGSLDAWLLERYCLYAIDGRDCLFRTVVQHPPWRFQKVEPRISANNLGEPFDLDLAREPHLAHFSSGVAALIWPFFRQPGLPRS